MSKELNPELLSEAIAKGADFLERQEIDFGKWSILMVHLFGEQLRPDLERIWTFANDEREMRRAAAPTLPAGDQPPPPAGQIDAPGRWELPKSIVIPVYVFLGVSVLLSVGISWHATRKAQVESAESVESEVKKQNAYDREIALQRERESENVKILAEIVYVYHQTHTYMGKQTGEKADIFVCGDMASDVWNMVRTAGIEAKIQIGSIERDINSPLEADHAWVLAQISPRRWLALETTGGFVVQWLENDRYFRGHSFSNPHELKEYSNLLRQLKTAYLKHNNAVDHYNQMVSEYNRADWYTRSILSVEVTRRRAVADQRVIDINEAKLKLGRLLSEGN